MKLVIFDCDGTLVDSQHGIVQAMAEGFVGAGVAPLPRERVLSVVGLSLPLAIERLLPEASPETIAQVTSGYREAFGRLRRDPDHLEPLYDGMLEVVETLSARDDVLLGVATGKSVRGVNALFDRFGLHSHFVTMQTADTHPSKPHPSMIERAMSEAGSEVADTVMIGDTTYDIEMATNAGVVSIGVAWGYHPVELLAGAGADNIVAESGDLLASIDGLLGEERGGL